MSGDSLAWTVQAPCGQVRAGERGRGRSQTKGTGRGEHDRGQAKLAWRSRPGRAARNPGPSPAPAAVKKYCTIIKNYYAGVSEGAVFHHFVSKADLLASCGERCAASLAGLITEWRKLQPGPPDFDAMFRFLFTWAREQRKVVHVMHLAASGISGGIGAGPRGLLVDAITENFAHWSAQGFLRPMEPRIVAELLGGLVETALANAFLFGPQDEERQDAYLRETVRCVELSTRLETNSNQGKSRWKLPL